MDRRPSTSLILCKSDDLPLAQRVDTWYLRAQTIARAYKLTAHDVTTLSRKFWAMHSDNIVAVDIAAMALLTIQYNLAAGTIAPWAEERPELQPLLQKILDFEVSLDAISLETRADMMDDGSFVLNTPHDGAAKFGSNIHATSCSTAQHFPAADRGRLRQTLRKAFAPLAWAGILKPGQVKGEDRGVRPFVVHMSDEKALTAGVRTRLIPERAGTGPLGHAVTWFDHVKLAPWACLGPLGKPKSPKAAFQASVWRISIGGLGLGAFAIPSVGLSAYILARYSLRRRVVNTSTGQLVPIISFRTQQLPILHALAQMFVMQAFLDGSSTFKTFNDFNTAPAVRAGISAAGKAAMMLHVQESCTQLSERAGAQGLYGHNQIINIQVVQLEMRGACIAEGDTLVLCIRLATELLIGRYELPPARYPASLAARLEAGLMRECREELHGKMGGQHRSDAFNRLLLPRCRNLVEAIGQRFFYDAARDAGLEQAVLDVYEANIVKHNPAWFAVHAGMDGSTQAAHEDAAISAAQPYLERWLKWSGAHEYALAPIMTQSRWDAFVETLSSFQGDVDVVHEKGRAKL
ncbi:acyl-CoA dehydrogenase NM domain-like protein [Mycena epipterygia]|nr:acyl-CoA dehydrogenase NM domain-like protein [Mycena epipterygia]